MFTVFYKKTSYNPNRSYYQNQNRYAGSKSFATLEEAVAYSKTVDAKYIINPAGNKIK
jgi:hypothetical protein